LLVDFQRFKDSRIQGLVGSWQKAVGKGNSRIQGLVGSWQKAVGKRQLAKGIQGFKDSRISWSRTNGSKRQLAKGIQGFKDSRISWQLAKGSWQREFKDSRISWQLAKGSWQKAVGKGNSKIQGFKD